VFPVWLHLSWNGTETLSGADLSFWKNVISGEYTMSYQELTNDADFTRAVKAIAQECKVNIDLAKLTCR